MNRFSYLLMIVLSATACAEDKHKDSDAVQDVVELKGSDIEESSGLAISHIRDHHWWTHNDSGGKPHVFAFNKKGKRTGKCRLDVKAKDWEDMSSFPDGGHGRLLIADCGDNLAKRKSIRLYLFDEPDPNESSDIKFFTEINVTYPDGQRNCEAVAVDVARRQIIMLEKATLPLAGIYAIDLPPRPRRPTHTEIDAVAKRVGTLTIPMITATDFDPTNGDLWVINYFQAFCYRRKSTDHSLSDQIQRLPEPTDLPKWKQIEAVAVDKRHQVWLTSEGKSAPLGRLKTRQR